MRRPIHTALSFGMAWIGILCIAGQAGALTPTEALELSAKTGRPILAMAGSETCGICQALKKRLTTDRSLQPLLAGYIPLEMKTDGGQDWGDWSRKFPSEGNGIPKVYVIRADGMALYAQSGYPDQLPQFLAQMLGQSGTILSPAELTKLSETVEQAKKAVEEGDMVTACRLITTAPGRGSYAAPAVEAGQIFEQIKQKAGEDIAKAKELFDSGELFEAAVLLEEANRAYSRLPEQKKELVTVLREVKSDTAKAEAMTQAEALAKAKLQEDSQNLDRAVRSYQQLAERYPNSPVAERALARLAELGTQGATSATTADSAPAPRTWTDRTGKYKIVASLVSVQGDKVRLKREDGKIVVLPINKLSAEDGQYVKENGTGR